MTAPSKELVLWRPEPVKPQTDRAVVWLLRLFGVLSLAGAVFMAWCAATGYRPF